MRVIIKRDGKPKTGKGFFVDRLIPELKKLGVDVCNDTSAKGDIALHIGRVHYKSQCKKNIIRVGPASVETNKNYKAINKAKSESVNKCDAVIYQSKYSKKAYHHFVCKPNIPETIIYNGAKQSYIEPETYNKTFLMCTRRWWPQKRLKFGIRAFLEAGIPSAELWIVGDCSMNKYNRKWREPSLKYLGVVNQNTLDVLRANCYAHIHLTYLDAAPNSVVESLVAGIPVVCTNQGGTPELVMQDESGYSTVLDGDKPYSFNPINLNRPPKIDVHELALQFVLYSKKRQSAFAPKLFIENIAAQYVEFFEECLK